MNIKLKGVLFIYNSIWKMENQFDPLRCNHRPIKTGHVRASKEWNARCTWLESTNDREDDEDVDHELP